MTRKSNPEFVDVCGCLARARPAMRVLNPAPSWLQRHSRLARFQGRNRVGRAGDWVTSPATAPDSRPNHGQPDAELAKVAGQTRLARAVAMLKFMGPALILPLSEPLMSLIDAVSLGQVCSHHLLQSPKAHHSDRACTCKHVFVMSP